MKCRNCGSIRVRRSSRRGITEGFLQRIAGRAPYRCMDCGIRFTASSRRRNSSRRRRHQGLAGWLGYRGAQQRRFKRRLLTAVLALVLLLVAIMLVLRLSEPGAPVDPTSIP